MIRPLTGLTADSAALPNGGLSDSAVAFLKPFIWVYRNLCWYGMQIERYTRRYIRRARHLFAPVAKAADAELEKYVRHPAGTAAAGMKQICADSRMAMREIKAANKRGGVRSMLAQTGHSIAAGAVKHKRFATTLLNYTLPVVCIALMLLVATTLYSRSYVLAVECDGALVGYVDDESTYTEATELVSERVITSNPQFRAALTPTYSLVSVNETKLNTAAEICNNILVGSSDVEDAYGFYVNGDLIGAVRSAGDLSYMTGEFLNRYKQGVANETVCFVEDTDVVKGLYSADMIVDSQTMRDTISSSQLKKKNYTVKSGDTVAGIASKYDMTPERFTEINGIDDTNLVSGGTVLVEKAEPVLRVKSVVTSTYESPIAYSTVTRKDPNKLTTYKECTVKGVPGSKLMQKDVTYIGGEQVDVKYTELRVLREPVDEVWVIGTKTTTTTKYTSNSHSYSYTAPAAPNVVGSGRFTWPLPGVNTISSRYGMRWGRLHSGIDISCGGVYGRTIVAADSGTVTTVKNSPSGYGLHVIISHGNGYSTLYGHCSAVLVSAGQKVSKGQAIAKVGNSGRSTGPHLHFEIRVNGTAKNPMNWF